MEAEYGWRETAGYYISEYFHVFWLVLMVLICGAILFDVLGKRWEKKLEKSDETNGEDNKPDK